MRERTNLIYDDDQIEYLFTLPLTRSLGVIHRDIKTDNVFIRAIVSNSSGGIRAIGSNSSFVGDTGYRMGRLGPEVSLD